MRTWLLALVGVVVAVPLDMALAALAPALWADSQTELLVGGAAAGGLAAGLLAWRVPFLLVLDHELAHLLMAVLCLRRPVGLQVGEETGLAEYSAGRGSTLILLAPYGWPWLAWMLCGLLVVVQIGWRDPVVGAIGAALGWSLVRVGLDLRPYQTDLKRVGRLPALVSVAAWGPLLFAVPTLFALGQLHKLADWVAEAGAQVEGLLALVG